MFINFNFFVNLELDFLHIMNNSKVDNENKEIFIFREGSFVAWNIPDPEIKTILSIVEDFEISKYDENIVNEETEIMPYTYSINRYFIFYQFFIVY